MMNETIKRVIISLLVFTVVFIGAGIVTRVPTYDGLIKTLEFLSAVIAAGCYWVGSNTIK